VATKLDRLPLSARKPTLARLGAGRLVVGTAQDDSKSIDALWRRVRALADVPSDAP
jgi:hypothetical protein